MRIRRQRLCFLEIDRFQIPGPSSRRPHRDQVTASSSSFSTNFVMLAAKHRGVTNAQSNLKRSDLIRPASNKHVCVRVCVNRGLLFISKPEISYNTTRGYSSLIAKHILSCVCVCGFVCSQTVRCKARPRLCCLWDSPLPCPSTPSQSTCHPTRETGAKALTFFNYLIFYYFIILLFYCFIILLFYYFTILLLFICALSTSGW